MEWTGVRGPPPRFIASQRPLRNSINMIYGTRGFDATQFVQTTRNAKRFAPERVGLSMGVNVSKPQPAGTSRSCTNTHRSACFHTDKTFHFFFLFSYGEPYYVLVSNIYSLCWCMAKKSMKMAVVVKLQCVHLFFYYFYALFQIQHSSVWYTTLCLIFCLNSIYPFPVFKTFFNKPFLHTSPVEEEARREEKENPGPEEEMYGQYSFPIVTVVY